MKKFLSIALIICLIVPFIGTYTVYYHQKSIIRKSVKKQLLSQTSKDDLVKFTFSREDAENLNWKHKKEFEYKGEMYDVVDFSVKGDSITYWCWWDHEETRLNKQLASLVAKAMGKDDNNNSNNKLFQNFLKSLFFKDIEPLPDVNQLCKLIRFVDHSKIYIHFMNDPLVPPPNFTL